MTEAEKKQFFVGKIMESPQKLDELDFDDYAGYLEKQGFKNMKVVLDQIVRELKSPFNDPRAPFQKMTPTAVFLALHRETEESLRPGRIITCKIVDIQMGKFMRMRATNSSISCQALVDLDMNAEKLAKFKMGQVVQARI